MDIISKAKELGTLISTSEELTTLRKSEIILESDQRAKTLMNDFKLLQIEMVKATKENRDKEVLASIKEKLLAKQEEINSYEITNNFLKAKAEFDSLMKKVNDVVVFAITGEEPCSPSKCGSCGGGCK